MTLFKLTTLATVTRRPSLRFFASVGVNKPLEVTTLAAVEEGANSASPWPLHLKAKNYKKYFKMSLLEKINVRKINTEDYKKEPQLSLDYGTAPTKYGNCLAAFHGNTLCFLKFYDGNPSLEQLQKTWPNVTLNDNEVLISKNIAKLFDGEMNYNIYLKGTDFELEVWEALLKLKTGKTASYEDIAKVIKRPKAVRAVGRAIGKNHIAYVVPCHRVIRKDGSVHKYASGPERKERMLKDEGAI